jgi:hypothetical protein
MSILAKCGCVAARWQGRARECGGVESDELASMEVRHEASRCWNPRPFSTLGLRAQLRLIESCKNRSDGDLHFDRRPGPSWEWRRGNEALNESCISLIHRRMPQADVP